VCDFTRTNATPGSLRSEGAIATPHRTSLLAAFPPSGSAQRVELGRRRLSRTMTLVAQADVLLTLGILLLTTADVIVGRSGARRPLRNRCCRSSSSRRCAAAPARRLERYRMSASRRVARPCSRQWLPPQGKKANGRWPFVSLRTRVDEFRTATN
jgi:hypothetical protein